MVKTKFMILLVSVFVLIALAELVVADANSTSCGTVNNGITLTANVSANADCFVLNASSVTIDCAGFMVSPALTTPNSRGVANNGFDNVVVKNCNFVYTSNTDRVIFFGGGTDNALIQNNTINGSTGNTVVGIDVFIRSPTNAYIENNIITTTGGGADGITIESATQVNRILNNTVTINDVSGTVTNGILLQNSLSTTVSGSNQINVNGNNTMGIRVTNSNSSVITSNIITIPGCPAGYAPTAMRFDASSTNNVVGTDMATQLDVLGNNLTLNCNGGNGILVTASNNVIKNSNIAGTGGNIFGIGLTTANNTNLTLNSITLTGAGTNCIQIATDSTNNQLTNNALTCMGAEIADAGGAHTNYLVYSNSNGQIAWTNAGFLSNLTLKGTGGIGLSVANIALNSNL
ncbi:hypothetical protein HZC30_04400, partial [Candidatus Woesearchaeota archaeon]|nr:hypothetical protein [Candidatus Woesearchaeota archaeon]